MKRKEPTKLLIEIPKTSIRDRLVKNGVPRSVFGVRSFYLNDKLTSFVSEVKGLKPKSVSKDKQNYALQKVLDNPFHGSYLCCISGKPNDSSANLLAAYIMMRALEIQSETEDEKLKRKLHHKSDPYFYSVTGFTKNELNVRPSLLILTNVPQGMTQYKMERLRDLLHVFSSVPRIVVTCNHDPVTFFNDSLYMRLNYGCFLTESSVKKSYEL